MAAQGPRVLTPRLAAALNATRHAREPFKPQQHVRGTSTSTAPPQTTLHAANLTQQEVIMQRLREMAEAAKGGAESRMSPQQLSQIGAHLLAWRVTLTTSEEELLNAYRGWVLTADY